ncbi:MAG: hypothetical protein HZA61_08685 [Candidatus Eisenbacteria bacterium]|uniref:Uncharacterized protein n=1 Tax=Eiseniibacteriota bacterium TaxID=2212470 RepID=A0A933SC02_UNCEI|nr:hypothetical protein [Candidatus Eisenbacteria bacterium]
MIFENDLFRFGTSGTLIALYGAVDHAARRAGGDPLRARVKPPRWLGALIFLSVLVFYLTIKPSGGAWAQGAGNVAGIALAGLAMALRWSTRRGIASLRQPDVAARMLFYVALPMAVGSAPGALALTLPAVLASAWCSRREDAILLAEHGEPWARRMATSARWVPGLW